MCSGRHVAAGGGGSRAARHAAQADNEGRHPQGGVLAERHQVSVAVRELQLQERHRWRERETTIAKYNREEVKRKSKVRAVAKFDPAKREAANAKRRKLAQPEAAPAPALLAAAPAALVHVPAALPKAPRMVPAEGPDRETKRDLALLRAWMDHRGDAEAALAELRERGLDVLGGEDEPWTVRRAQERHEFLCRCVRTFARLLPEGADMRRVCGLMRQCS